MNDTQTPVKRYNIGYSSDEWGMRSSTAGGLPDSNGKWVRYSDIEPLLKPLTPPDGWVMLTADQLKALLRFQLTCEDGEGYDVPKKTMKELASIGVVNHINAGIYSVTKFGEAILDMDAKLKELK